MKFEYEDLVESIDSKALGPQIPKDIILFTSPSIADPTVSIRTGWDLLVNDNLDVTGTLTATTISPLGNFTVPGNLEVVGTSLLTGAVTMTDIVGNLDIGGTLDVTGATTLDTTCDVVGNATVGGTLDVTGNIDGDTIAAGVDVTAGNDVVAANDVTATAGVVTAGTDVVAGSDLSVGGDAAITGHLVADGMTKVRVYESTGQTITTNNIIRIAFDQENYDVLGEYTNPTFTCTKAGYYLITVQVALDGLGNAKNLRAYVYIDGSEVVKNISLNGAAAAMSSGVTTVQYLAVDATVEGHVRHNHGGDRDLVAGTENTYMEIIALP